MAFEKLDQPPSPGEYIEIIRERDKEAGISVLALPALALIARERLHWRRMGRSADPKELPGIMAAQLTPHLSELMDKTSLAETVAQQYGAIGGEVAHSLTRWYSEAAIVVPYSAFLRVEAAPLLEDPYVLDGTQRFFPDFTDDELDKAGVHIADEIAGMVEGLQPQKIGQEVWYEGETIYLRARKPAEPTVQFYEGFRASRERHFDRAAYISLAPRMKTEAWLT